MKIELVMKEDFGKKRFYAKDAEANDAFIMLKLMKCKSFTAEQVKMMQKAGWDIKISSPAIEF